MNKTWIIIGREFSTRVRKKSFLVLTLVVPLLMAGFYAFLMWMLLKDDTQERRIAVANRSAIETPFRQINNTVFEYTETEVPEKKNTPSATTAYSWNLGWPYVLKTPAIRTDCSANSGDNFEQCDNLQPVKGWRPTWVAHELVEDNNRSYSAIK